jgi:tetratricopeptide (TPR) repeat protein
VNTLANATDVAIQTRNFNDAIDFLRRLVARQADGSPELADRAKKTLAVLLALSRNRQYSAEALKLLNLQEDGTPFHPTPDSPTEDLRSTAEVLTLKGGPRNLKVALDCAQAIIDRGNPGRDDRFLLAQILELSGDWPKASEQVQLALLERDPRPFMIAFYIRGLLVHEKGQGAKPWLETLEKLDPSSAATTELKARLANAEGQPEKASRLILDHARAYPETTFAFAQLLESLGRIDDAEKLYREFAKAEKKPEASLPLATFLGRQNRVKDALGLCDTLWNSLRPELVAKTSVEILYASAAGEDDCRRVLDHIEAALRKSPKMDLKLSRVYVQMLREKYDDAEALFGELHRNDEKNSVWANNLAMVLTFQEGKTDKAIALIDEAIDIVGPVASLLDTRGVAKAVAGRRQDAIDDFLKATSAEPNAERYLHLALAYQKANRTLDAKEALKKANDLGLDRSKLQPRDRKDYGKLATDLEGG